MKHIRTALTAASLLVIASLSYAAVTPSLTFSPLSTTQSGGSVSITARINGLKNGTDPDQILTGFSFRLQYDNSKLSYTGSTFLANAQYSDSTPAVDPFLSFLDTPNSSCGGGTVPSTVCFVFSTGLSDADLFAAQTAGAFDLFSMSFNLLDTSNSWSTLLDVAPSNTFTPEFTGSGDPLSGIPTILNVTTGSARVTNVPAVVPPTGLPVPASIGLVAMALMAAGAAGRTRRRETSAV